MKSLSSKTPPSVISVAHALIIRFHLYSFRTSVCVFDTRPERDFSARLSSEFGRHACGLEAPLGGMAGARRVLYGHKTKGA